MNVENFLYLVHLSHAEVLLAFLPNSPLPLYWDAVVFYQLLQTEA